jgi:DNA polymerase III gamma/tau subunit
MRNKLDCGDQDFQEVNCADFRGIDMVRDIRNRMNLAPIGGECRVWLIDEAHQLSSQAQNAFLKILEDTPSHVYFMLATTDPQKLIPTIRTRCAEFKVSSLNPMDAATLLGVVCEKEKIELPEEVMECLIKHGDGSPRKLLVLLDGIRHLEGEEDQLESIRNSDGRREAIQLARLLIYPDTTWNDVRKVLQEITEEPESLRWMVLGYANSVLLKGGQQKEKAYLIIDAFRDNFYDSKKAGLSAACWEIINT